MAALNSFKAALLDQCRSLAAQKEAALLKTLADLADSLGNETKSTAGDKYETARAMLHIEQANTARQLQEAKAQKVLLDQIVITTGTYKVAPGSLVSTDKGLFFLSAALGKVVVDGVTLFVLSAQSPLGSRLMSGRVGHKIAVNGTEYLIKEIS